MNEHQTNKASQLTLLDKWRWLGTVAATPSLPAAALAAAHVLADYTGRGGLAFPSYATVAGRTGRSRRSAMRGVVALEHAGLIVAAEGGRRGTRAWRLNVAAPLESPDGAPTAGDALTAPPLRHHCATTGAVAQRCQERHEGVTRMARGGDMDVTSLVTGLAVSGVEHVTRSPLDIPCDLRQEITGDKSKGSALTPGVALRTHPSADAAGWVRGDAGAPVTADTAADRLAQRLASMVPASKTSGDPAVLVGAVHDALVVVSADRVIAAYREHLDGTPPQYVERPDRFLARAGWKRPVTHREPRRLAAGGAAGGGG